MRVTILIISACVALFFLASIALTFFAKGYITSQAREFVIVRTQRLAEPAVDLAEQALRQPGIKKVLDEEAIRNAQLEIAEYRRDPRAYIAFLAAEERLAFPAVSPGRNAPLVERVARWKLRVREHFEQTLDRLVRDLRIFSGSNLVAALIAACCAMRAQGRQLKWLLVVAGILLASVAFGAYMYIDGMTYFRILFSTYLGWWYPVLLGITFVQLYLEYGPSGDETRGPTESDRRSGDTAFEVVHQESLTRWDSIMLPLYRENSATIRCVKSVTPPPRSPAPSPSCSACFG